MSIMTNFQQAPLGVKYISSLNVVSGLVGVCFGIKELVLLRELGSRNFLTALVVLQFVMSGLLIFTSMKLVLHARWARTFLEVITWISVAYFCSYFVFSTTFAFFHWDEYKAAVADDWGKRSISSLSETIFDLMWCIATITSIFYLRSASTRSYVELSRK